jgi:hypothetical protein
MAANDRSGFPAPALLAMGGRVSQTSLSIIIALVILYRNNYTGARENEFTAND